MQRHAAITTRTPLAPLNRGYLRRHTGQLCTTAATLALLCGCATKGHYEGPGPSTRGIPAEELLGTQPWDGNPADNSQFMPVQPLPRLADRFQGTLQLGQVEMMTDGPLTTRYPFRSELARQAVEPFFYEGADAKLFPPVQIRFFTCEEALVPVIRQVIRPPLADRTKGGYESFWDIVVDPGKVWREEADNGWNRASFPFALVSSLEGDTRNGLATFLYRRGEVSDLRFQIVQQTEPYMQLDDFTAWGQTPASFQKETVPGLQDLQSQYQAEVSARYPMRPFAELAARHPGRLDDFALGLKATNDLGSALVVDGVIYYLPLQTPYGVYPYMESLRYGVWSVSKGFVGGIAMLRLAQKFGPEVYDERLLDYFDPAENNSGHHGWDAVRFGHCIDMNTGMGSPDGYWTRKDVNSWYYAYTLGDKLKHLFTEPDLPQGPGEAFVYNDEDIWILGVAMERYLRKQEGPEATIFGMLSNEVYAKAGVAHLVTTTLYTDDGITPGLPHFSWGFLPTMDDLAKITDLLHGRGFKDGEQILHSGKISEFFAEKPKQPIDGFMMGSGYVEYIDPADDNRQWVIPASGGMGGHQIILMPNGTTALRFAKNSDPDSEDMINVSNDLKPFKDFR